MADRVMSVSPSPPKSGISRVMLPEQVISTPPPKSAISRTLLSMQDDDNIAIVLDKSPETEVMNVIKSILFMLKLLGTWPKEGAAFTLRMNFWNYIVVGYLHIYTIHMTLNWFSVVKHTQKVFAAFEQMTGILRTFVCALTIDIRFKRHDHMMEMLQAIASYPTLNREYHLKTLKSRITILTIGSLIFISVNVGLGIYTLIYKDPRGYVNWLLYGDFSNVINLEFIRMVMVIDWGIYLGLVVLNECFSKSFYVSLCLLLRMKIRDYNEFLHRLERRDMVKGTQQIQELYTLHTQLTSMVTEFDRHYCLPVLMWYISLLVNVCVKIESIVSGVKESNFSQFMYLITDISYYSIAFLAISLIASGIGEDDSIPIMSVHRIAERGDARDWHFQHEAQMLLTKLTTPMMRLSGWGCFYISKSFVLTVVGTLATYTIIIIQMHQDGGI